jgi:hypothetical protein
MCIEPFSLLTGTRIFKLNAVMNMGTDFCILLVPVRPVLRLQVHKLRKMYLLIVLCFSLV